MVFWSIYYKCENIDLNVYLHFVEKEDRRQHLNRV